MWETRAIYPNLDALTEDLSRRAGRSILHELTDAELYDLVSYIRERFRGKEEQEIVEQDRWTIWWAVK